MNGKSRFSITILQSLIVFSGIFLFTLQGFAGVSNIFKWKDDQGKVHFTDDPLKIPSRYRSPDQVEKRRALPAPKSRPVAPSPAVTKKQIEDQGEDAAKSEETDSNEEQAAMQEAINFLKSDIQRYEKYKDFIPQIRHHRALKQDIVAVLPQKEALKEKLGKQNSVLLKDISGFLKKSLQLDHKAKDQYPKSRLFSLERTRIAGENVEKNNLIQKLEAELASGSNQGPASSQPTPQSTAEQAPEEKKPESGYYK